MFNKSFVKGLAITLTAVTIATGASAAFTKPAYAGDLATEGIVTESESVYDLNTENGINTEYTDSAKDEILSSLASDSFTEAAAQENTETTADSDTKTTDSANTEAKENSDTDILERYAGISATVASEGDDQETFYDSNLGQHILDYLTKVPEDKKTDADKFFETLLKYTNLGSLLSEYFENGTGMKDENSFNDSEKTFFDQLIKAFTGSVVNTDIKEMLVKFLGDKYGKLVGFYGAALNAVGSVDELIKAFECSGAGPTIYHLVKSLEKAGFAYISVLPGGGYVVAGINALEAGWNTAVVDTTNWLLNSEHGEAVLNFFNKAPEKLVGAGNDATGTFGGSSDSIGAGQVDTNVLPAIISYAKRTGNPVSAKMVEAAKAFGIDTTGVTVME